MNRRTFIGTTIAGVISGCAGAIGSRSNDPEQSAVSTAAHSSTPTRDPSPSQTSTPTQRDVPESQTVEMGATLVIGDVTELTVSMVGYSEHVIFNDGRDFTAEDGTHYLLTHVVAEGHDGNRLGAFPRPESFRLSTHSRTFPPETQLIDWVDFGTVIHPVSERLYVGGAVGSQRRSEGLVVFNIPDDVSGLVEVEMSLPEFTDPLAIWRGHLRK